MRSLKSLRVWLILGLFLALVIALLIGLATIIPDQNPQVGKSPAESQEAPAAESARTIKIHTGPEGIYRLRGGDLRREGFDIASGSDEIHLLQGGGEIPFWVQPGESGDDLLFYAWDGGDLYYTGNYFWLVSGGTPAALVATQAITTPVSAAASQAPAYPPALNGAYLQQLVIDDNVRYFPQALEGDHWFSFILAAPGKREVPFTADGIIAADAPTASIRLTLWASSEAQGDPDHHWRVSLNGQVVADELWDGRGLRVIESQFPSNFLIEGENLIAIEAPGDTGVTVDVTNLDKIEILYPRRPAAIEQSAAFVVQVAGERLSGFSSGMQVFDVSNPRAAANLGTVSDSGSLPVGVREGMHIMVATEAGLLDPLELTQVDDLESLRQVAPGASYLAFAPAEFLPPLEPLLAYRSSEGLAALGVDLQQVYDQFNFGQPEPDAIDNFLRYASEAWEVRPQYVLLVGDATYDPRGYTSSAEANRLPTFLEQTVYGGQTATDVGFVQLNDDPWPDLPVGRVPARSPEQVRIFVEKTLAYERGERSSPSALDVFAVADGQETTFKQDAQNFLDLFPVDFRLDLYTPQAGVADGPDAIRSGFDNGVGLVTYFGHGSLDTWGKDRLFDSQAVAGLSPSRGQLPVVLNLTCLTGLYTHPTHDSLAEALLFSPADRGAVAVLAPSSLTLPTDQSFLSHSFVEALLEDADMRLGDMHLFARRQVPLESATSRDVMSTFMLFGDPALNFSLSPP